MSRRFRRVALAAFSLSFLAAVLGMVPLAHAQPQGVERAGTNLCRCPTQASVCFCDAYPV